MSQFESLANELILDIFEFLNTAHLICAFLDLNSRFKYLLHDYVQNHVLDLRSISKHHFHQLCERHLPSLIKNITSIRLSNNDETPQLPELFFSYGLSIDRFIQLKSIALYKVSSPDTFDKIIFQCQSLPCFDHLSLFECVSGPLRVGKFKGLPKLTHCIISGGRVDITYMFSQSIIPPTLKYLSWTDRELRNRPIGLKFLLKWTPCLEYLKIEPIYLVNLEDQLKRTFSSLVSLRTLVVDDDVNKIENLFQLFPNLTHVTLEILSMYLDGNVWRKWILVHLSKIKIFRLKMRMKIPDDSNIYETIDRLLDSFRTEFWLQKHDWYVQCDCYRRKDYNEAVLYTLPNVFDDDDYDYSEILFAQSTKPNEEKCFVVNNARYLEMRLPLADFSIKCKVMFNRLSWLSVYLNDDFGYDQLQILINQTRCLYSLILISFGQSYDKLFQLTSSSIRRLHLMKAQISYGRCFDHQDCKNLVNSPLGYQCEVLFIELENYMDIVYLHKKIPLLRILFCQLKYINEDYRRSSLTYENINRWLRRHLSSRSMMRIHVGAGSSKLAIWIHREAINSFTQKIFYFFLFKLVRRLFSLRICQESIVYF